MTQLEGFTDPYKPTAVGIFRKALYGLKQVHRAWFDHLKVNLHQWGFQSSISNSSLLFHYDVGSLIFLLVYIDDILTTCDDYVEEWFKSAHISTSLNSVLLFRKVCVYLFI